MLSIGAFSVLALLTFYCLRQVTLMQLRNSGREEALRNLLRASEVLQRDLVNSAPGPEQFAFQAVNLGTSVHSSDAVAVLVDPQDQNGLTLDSGGGSVHTLAVTYYLAIPPNVDSLAGTPQVMGADGQGYEDQCPFKWLVRKQEPAPLLAPPAVGTGLPPNWILNHLEQPTSLWREPQRQVVSAEMLQFRILHGPPQWDIELRAAARDEARKNLALGQTPLSPTRFCLRQRITVITRN